MELCDPPSGPIADDSQLAASTLSQLLTQKGTDLEQILDSLAERLVSSSPPLPDSCSPILKQRKEELEALQQEAWFCHWGIVVSLCVYQQLITHVAIGVRKSVAQALGAFLAEGERVDNTRLYDLIESEFKVHGITLKPDMDLIHRELACTALHSTVVCYIRDIALNMHEARQLGVHSAVEAMFPYPGICVGRNFLLRFAKVSSALLDILYDVLPQIKGVPASEAPLP